MTNYLYLCSLSEEVTLSKNEPRQVLMRIYGEIVDLKQRFYESIIFTMLSERKVGPRSYGVFYSGRLEQYYPVNLNFFPPTQIYTYYCVCFRILFIKLLTIYFSAQNITDT